MLRQNEHLQLRREPLLRHDLDRLVVPNRSGGNLRCRPCAGGRDTFDRLLTEIFTGRLAADGRNPDWEIACDHERRGSGGACAGLHLVHNLGRLAIQGLFEFNFVARDHDCPVGRLTDSTAPPSPSTTSGEGRRRHAGGCRHDEPVAERHVRCGIQDVGVPGDGIADGDVHGISSGLVQLLAPRSRLAVAKHARGALGDDAVAVGEELCGLGHRFGRVGRVPGQLALDGHARELHLVFERGGLLRRYLHAGGFLRPRPQGRCRAKHRHGHYLSHRLDPFTRSKS